MEYMYLRVGTELHTFNRTLIDIQTYAAHSQNFIQRTMSQLCVHNIHKKKL